MSNSESKLENLQCIYMLKNISISNYVIKE